MKCTYFNAFTGVPVYSRARKIEIKWAKTASPPIRVASQYESINVSPPFGLSVNRLSPPFIRRPRMACFETVDFRKGTLQVFRDTRVSIHHRETRTLLRASISSRSARMTERGTIRCFSLKSNILNGGSKWVVVLQREMDHVFLKVWWSRGYLWLSRHVNIHGCACVFKCLLI